MSNSTNLTHIAIIMDGNRRWARKNGLPDEKGHEEGSRTLEKIVYGAKDLGIKTITVYALSTENLKKRAKRELSALFQIFKEVFSQKFQDMAKNGIKVEMFGDIGGLPESIQTLVRKVLDTYIENESIKVNIALNYGGQDEMIHVIKELISKGIEIDKINSEIIEKHLYLKNTEPPQLVIRTGGNFRLSNFLLWQTGYSELYFSDKLWPDFSVDDLATAIEWYKSQERKFGK